MYIEVTLSSSKVEGRAPVVVGRGGADVLLLDELLDIGEVANARKVNQIEALLKLRAISLGMGFLASYGDMIN